MLFNVQFNTSLSTALSPACVQRSVAKARTGASDERWCYPPTGNREHAPACAKPSDTQKTKDFDLEPDSELPGALAAGINPAAPKNRAVTGVDNVLFVQVPTYHVGVLNFGLRRSGSGVKRSCHPEGL